MNAKDRRLSLQYSAFQFGYWVDYLIAFSFGAVLLAGRGFQPTEIGYVTTIGSLLTIALQSGLSTLADKSEKITVWDLLTCLILGCAAVAALLALVPHAYAVSFICMFTTLGLVSAMQPFMVSLCLQSNAAGFAINYGIARSIGSMGYAAAGYVMGRVTEALGAEAVLPIFIVILAALLLLLRLMKLPTALPAVKPAAKSAEKPSGFLEFFRKYKRYDLFLISVILIFFAQTILNTYLIYFVTYYGGGKAEMGLVLSVCAFSEMPAVFLGVPLLKKLSAARMLRISALSGLLKFALMLIIPNVAWLIALGALHFFYTGFYSVSSIFYANSIVDEKDAVKAQGFLSVSVTGLVGILANLAGGYLLEYTTIRVILVVGVGVEAVCTVLMFLATGKRWFRK